MSKTQELNKSLAFSRALLNLASQAECQQVLIPYLQNKLRNQWLDPRECKDLKDFNHKYNLAFAMAQVSQELIDLLTVESINARITNINNAIEADKLLDNNSYTLEGEGNDKSTPTSTK